MFCNILAVSTHVFLFMLFFCELGLLLNFDDNSCSYCHMTDMSTETFMRCLKCFAARRGVPCKFVSDNRKTFKVAARFICVQRQCSAGASVQHGCGVEIQSRKGPLVGWYI